MSKAVLRKWWVKLIPLLASWFLRVWFSTCRVTECGSENRQRADENNNAVIAIFWHFSLLYVFYHLRSDSATVLVSASEDGDYIAELAKNLNFDTARGSRNKGGLRALKELMVCLKKGRHVGIVADGSQGPPLVVQSGAILMASRTGAAILPMTWSASRYLSVRSWDRTALPLPFSRIRFHYGEPVYVPSGIEGDVIEEHRKVLELKMNELYRQAWSVFGKEAH